MTNDNSRTAKERDMVSFRTGMIRGVRRQRRDDSRASCTHLVRGFLIGCIAVMIYRRNEESPCVEFPYPLGPLPAPFFDAECSTAVRYPFISKRAGADANPSAAHGRAYNARIKSLLTG